MHFFYQNAYFSIKSPTNLNHRTHYINIINFRPKNIYIWSKTKLVIKMVLKNKLRNIQMFGYSGFGSKRSHQLLVGITLVAIFFFLGKSSYNEDIKLTGLVVEESINEIEETLADQEDDNTVEETLADQEDETYETYEYYEYGGECSYKIKQAEDDVNDIKSYSGVEKEEYDKLKDEYNEKLKELDSQYKSKIDLAKEKYDNSQKDLTEARNELQELQEVCAF